MPTALTFPVYGLGDWAGNVIDDDGVGWVVTEADGWDSPPPVRGRVEERESGHGGTGRPSLFGPRVISLRGTADGTSRAAVDAAKERLAHALPLTDQATFTVQTMGGTRWAQVRATADVRTRDKGPVAFEWDLTVTATDYRRYAEDPIVASATIYTEDPAVREYPFTHPRVYDATGVTGADPGTIFLTNTGREPTPVVLQITGPVASGWKIYHTESLRTVGGGFDLPLAEGEYLIVDTGRGTARLNGTASRTAALDRPQWFLLQPGLNTIRYIATETAPGTAETAPSITGTAYPAWR